MNLLETIDLKKSFGETHAVDNVSLNIAEREFVSLVGPNGAGKTTLINVISALLPADAGKILFKGDDITRATVTERVKAGIARSFQIVNLFDDLTAFDNVTLAIFSRQGKTGHLAALAHRDHEVSAEADTVLEQFNLSTKRNERARDLAQGERKLLDVALAYALRPKLLFLDEPTSGVSTRDKGQIMDTIASVVRGEGITAVIVEHDMDVVFKYSDRIVVMHQGAILAQGPPDAIRQNDQVATILLGSSDAFARKD
jgi:branched-chain amino acid transport system ATP-binding protein